MAKPALIAAIKSFQAPAGTVIRDQFVCLDAALKTMIRAEVLEVVSEVVRDADSITIVEMIGDKQHEQHHPLGAFILERWRTISQQS